MICGYVNRKRSIVERTYRFECFQLKIRKLFHGTVSQGQDQALQLPNARNLVNEYKKAHLNQGGSVSNRNDG
ncbi:hypothetical protein ACTXT7_009946 [Hymenolepis weldensis]